MLYALREKCRFRALGGALVVWGIRVGGGGSVDNKVFLNMW